MSDFAYDKLKTGEAYPACGGGASLFWEVSRPFPYVSGHGVFR